SAGGALALSQLSVEMKSPAQPNPTQPRRMSHGSAPPGSDMAAVEAINAVKASSNKPLILATLPRNTVSYIARLMIKRWAPLPLEAGKETTFSDVIPDILEGRSDIGIMPTAVVARQQDVLSCLLTFGAKRSPIFSNTPTFAEITGNRELSFTESVGVLGAPGWAADKAATLTGA